MGNFDLSTAQPVQSGSPQNTGGFDLSTARPVQSQQAPQGGLQGALGTLQRIGGGYLNYLDYGFHHPLSTVEQGAHLASGAIGGLGGGLAFLGKLATSGGDADAAKAAQEATQSALTYTPRTTAGKKLAGAIDNAMAIVPQAGNAAGSFIADKTGSPLLGAAVNTGINAVPLLAGLRRGIGTNAEAAEASAAATEQAANAPKAVPTTPQELTQQSLDNGTNVGYQLPPNLDPKASTFSRLVQSVASKTRGEQGVVGPNQNITNALAARGLDLDPQTLITKGPQGNLAAIRKAAFEQGYQPISQLEGVIPTDGQFLKNNAAIKNTHANDLSANPDVQAAADLLNKPSFKPDVILDNIGTLRSKASDAFAQGRSDAASGFRKQASELESLLDRHLQDSEGLPPDMLTKYRAARQLIAKSHLVEDNLNPSTGNVDASGFAEALNKGTPLTGDHRIIADFANAAPAATTIPKGVPLPSSAATHLAGAALAHATGGASLVAIPLARSFASKWISARATNPALLQPTNKTFGNTAMDAIHGNAKAFNNLYGSTAPGVDLSTDQGN